MLTASSMPPIASKDFPNKTVTVENAIKPFIMAHRAAAPAAKAIPSMGANIAMAPRAVATAENLIIAQANPIVALTKADIFSVTEII